MPQRQERLTTPHNVAEYKHNIVIWVIVAEHINQDASSSDFQWQPTRRCGIRTRKSWNKAFPSNKVISVTPCSVTVIIPVLLLRYR
jgi:hypothetical protein